MYVSSLDPAKATVASIKTASSIDLIFIDPSRCIQITYAGHSGRGRSPTCFATIPGRLSQNKGVSETVRAFVALSLPDEAAELVARAVEQIRVLAKSHGVRGSWTRHPHLTLVFLGQTSLIDVSKAEQAIRNACQGFPALAMHVRGVGGFPSLSRPRVVWLGLTGDIDELKNLQGRIASALQGVGEHREKKPFNPHITVGRLRESPPASFNKALKELQDGHLADAVFDQVHLFRSELSPKGAKYTPLVSVSLEEPV
jgi:RNA 2',3'-cyclic 3'-phosphodiesterase